MILGEHSGTSTPNSTTSSRGSGERPAHHVIHPVTGTLSFKNPWPSAGAPTASELLFGGAWLGWPKLHLNKHPKARELQVLDPGDFGKAKVAELKQKARDMGKGDKVGFARATWLGHAGMYVQIPLETPVDPISAFQKLSVAGEGEEDKRDSMQILQDAEREGSILHLLFDPIFSERAGPTSYTGPGRIRPTPCGVEGLPEVHAVLISHNHYDHLDASSIKAVLEKYPRARYFVPLGNRPWFAATGVPMHLIHECDWWDEVKLSPADFGIGPTVLASPFPETTSVGGLSTARTSRSSATGSPDNIERIRFTCVPAQHNSGRSPGDQGSTLWCGWVVEYLIESDRPVPPSTSTKKAAPSSSVDSLDIKRANSAQAPPVLVEEPEEVEESAIDDEEAEEASERTGTHTLQPPSTSLEIPPTSAFPDGSTTPTESLSDISIDTNESNQSDGSTSQRQRRSSSVSQLLHRPLAFSKQVTRHLSLSRKKDAGGTDRSASLPVTDSHHAPDRPHMSRSSSLRAARELQQEQAASGITLNVPETNADGTKSAPPSGTDAPTLETEDPEIRERLLRETEEELHRVRDEKKRERAERKTRDQEEVSRTMREGQWTRRVLRKGAIYHAGDTGYRRHRRCAQPVCPAFDEIGLKFGPFDLSFVPIWRGGSLGFVSAIGLRLHHENISSAVHGCPADAVDIHLDVRSRNTIGMHFGTFIGAESESLEAIIELAEAVEDAGVKTLDDPNEDEMGKMGVIDVGETWCTEIHPLLIVT
ncbi:hypothetical protein JCM10908_000309 [Rhodotorula pacifica]|uniref:uncharacterized protein n=1 Tax=Rhodotorula pacifica TaxID=1495444 RepID=UPI00317BC836